MKPMDRRAVKKTHRKLIEQTNKLIQPLGCRVTGPGPESVGVLGDDRSVGIAIIISVPVGVDVIEISTLIINRVKGITRVLMDIPT
jgi:GMP synthase PP-ATPase subunit